MKIFHHSVAAWFALLGIFFCQLVVSAYACPVLISPAAAQQMKVMDMAGMPCADTGMGVDVEQPALCAQHCDQGNQTVGTAQALDFQPALVLLLVLQVAAVEAMPGLLGAQAPLLARSASPPPLWRTGRLRI